MKKKLCFTFWRFSAITLILVSLSGCRTQVRLVEVEKPVYIRDTTNTILTVHDSTVVERERVVEVKGDTVFVTQTEKTNREVSRADTVRLVTEVPVVVNMPEPYPVEIEVEKPLSWFQRTLMYIGIATLCCALLWVVYLILKRRIGR